MVTLIMFCMTVTVVFKQFIRATGKVLKFLHQSLNNSRGIGMKLLPASRL